MKKSFYFFSILFICFLTACGTKKGDTVETQNTALKQGENIKKKIEYYDFGSGLSETENGYYFYSNSMRITYVDKETMEATPLCFNPSCEHLSDESCPAYARYIRNLQIHNGKLYADITVEKELNENICSYVNLYEMDLDGSNKKKVMEIYNTEDIMGSESSSYSLTWNIIDDMVYVFASQSHGEKDNNVAFIDRYSLSTGKKIDRFYEEKLKGINSSVEYSVSLYDKSKQELYLSASRSEEKNIDTISEEQKQQLAEQGVEIDDDFGGSFIEMSDYYARCNLKDQTIEPILPDENVGCLALFQDKLCMRQDNNLVFYDIETNQKSNFLTMETIDKYALVAADENYIYVDNSLAQNHEIDGKKPSKEELFFKIYDKDKKLIDKLNMPLPNCMRFYGTDKIIFLTDSKCYYLDKNKIGTGELELIEIPGVK